MIVKLLERVGAMNAGEVGGFSDELAAKLIAEGKAVEFAEGMPLRSKPEAEPAPEPVVLRMIVAAEGLNTGEVAGFHPDIAKRLVEQGKASVYEIDPDLEVVNMDDAARAKRDKEVERARLKAKEDEEKAERKRQAEERAEELRKAREAAAAKKAEEKAAADAAKKKAADDAAAKKEADAAAAKAAKGTDNKVAKGTRTKGGR